MPKSRAELTIFYSLAQEDKSITIGLDSCEVSVEHGVREVTPKNGYRCYEVTDQISINLNGTRSAAALSPRTRTVRCKPET